jgi:hypothetical protein
MVSPPVIPAKAGIQSPKDFEVALDPRFRGGDEIVFTSSRAFRVAGPKAFAEAGIMHNDVDPLMIMSNEPP